VIEADQNIYRLVWHSFDFEADGALKGAAFTSADLRPDLEEDGTPKFVSIDQVSKISKPSVDWRIETQQADGKRERLGRYEAKFVEFNCEELRSVTRDGKRQFEVTAEPELEGADGPGSPENPAHCALRHISGFTGTKGALKSYIDYLRTQLLKHKRAIVSYEAVFPSKEELGEGSAQAL
jgi:hypothetical protein